MVTDASPDARCRGVTVARVEVITDENRCGIDPCSPAVIGRCSQCALVSVDRATVSRARQKCRPHPRWTGPGLAIGLDGWPFDPKYPVYRRGEAGFGRNSVKPID